jgi:hypothetical protein
MTTGSEDQTACPDRGCRCNIPERAMSDLCACRGCSCRCGEILDGLVTDRSGISV